MQNSLFGKSFQIPWLQNWVSQEVAVLGCVPAANSLEKCWVKARGEGKAGNRELADPVPRGSKSSGLVAAFPWDPDLFLFILQEGLDQPSWVMQCSRCVASESSTSLSVSCAGAAQRPLGTQNSLQ